MLITEKKADNQQIGFSSSIHGGIDPNDIGKILKALSKTLYENPLGSVIRELCSNQYDAYIGTDKTPIVLVEFDASQQSLLFIDKGKGMSAEFMEKHYKNWGYSLSSKEADAIGMYGFGSKSPFALSTVFYIETACEGSKRLYSFSFDDGVNSKPDLDLLHEEVSNETGTTIKVPLPKFSAYDIFEQIKSQLKYFDSVILQKLPEFKGEIVHGNNFVLNTEYTKELEICFGKISYPIKFDLLPSTHSIQDYRRLPIALKFELNEGLIPSPSRESLIFDAETIQKILTKFEKAQAELLEMYEKQRYFNSILEWAEKGFTNKLHITDTHSIFWVELFRKPVLQLPFEHHFRNFDSTLVRLIKSKFYLHRNKEYKLKFYADKLDSKRAKNANGGIIYGSKINKLTESNYQELIGNFYEPVFENSFSSKIVKGIRAMLNDEGKLLIQNPEKIDWKTEIHQFLNCLDTELRNSLIDLKTVPLLEIQERRKQNNEVIEYHYNSLNKSIYTDVETLSKYRFLIYIDRQTIKEVHKEIVRKFSSVRFNIGKRDPTFLYKFIITRPTQLKTLKQIKGFITFDDFVQTNLYQKTYVQNLLIKATRQTAKKHSPLLKYRHISENLKRYTKEGISYLHYYNSDDVYQFLKPSYLRELDLIEEFEKFTIQDYLLNGYRKQVCNLRKFKNNYDTN